LRLQITSISFFRHATIIFSLLQNNSLPFNNFIIAFLLPFASFYYTNIIMRKKKQKFFFFQKKSHYNSYEKYQPHFIIVKTEQRRTSRFLLNKGYTHIYAQLIWAVYFFKPTYPHIKQLWRHTPRNLWDYWSWSLSIWAIPTDESTAGHCLWVYA